MKVFLPSWNGDFRLEADGEWCKLVLADPTAHELQLVGEFLRKAEKKHWITAAPPKDQPHDGKKLEVSVAASLGKASKLLISVARPIDRTLTAVRFSDGKMEVVEGASAKALDKAEELIGKAQETEKPGEPAAAASVKRPTPSCPSCMQGAVKPASEVLLSFLTDDEHSDWSRKRAIVVEGGLTGHRYLLAHRNSDVAGRIGRICFDLDDQVVIHFHDWSVPPEEEVLAAKVILAHREHWLRNEATLYDSVDVEMFKNPFGDGLDGTESAQLASSIGEAILGGLSEKERLATIRHYDISDSSGKGVVNVTTNPAEPVFQFTW
jgi:hypothetical protein